MNQNVNYHCLFAIFTGQYTGGTKLMVLWFLILATEWAMLVIDTAHTAWVTLIALDHNTTSKRHLNAGGLAVVRRGYGGCSPHSAHDPPVEHCCLLKKTYNIITLLGHYIECLVTRYNTAIVITTELTGAMDYCKGFFFVNSKQYPIRKHDTIEEVSLLYKFS